MDVPGSTWPYCDVHIIHACMHKYMIAGHRRAARVWRMCACVTTRLTPVLNYPDLGSIPIRRQNRPTLRHIIQRVYMARMDASGSTCSYCDIHADLELYLTTEGLFYSSS